MNVYKNNEDFWINPEDRNVWDWIMTKMVAPFEWLSANYKCAGNNEIPDEVVFGFHAFAEFLIEMNQP